MDWDRLRVFLAVNEAGSFTRAGRTLGLSQSAVSRQISALEGSMSVKLFHRHARGLMLTEQGEMLHRTVKNVFHELAMVEAQLSETRDHPSGPLKVTTTVSFGSTWLTPRIKEFVELYPEVDFSLILSDTELDLSMRKADIGIRMTPPRQVDLIQRRLATMRHGAFAAPSYLNEHGTPHSLEDLDRHRLIAYDTDSHPHPPFTQINWMLTAGLGPGRSRQPVLRANNIYGMYRAAASGLGIASLPDYMGEFANDLVPVLTEMEGPAFDIYLVYPEELRNSQRIIVFRDFLVRRIAGDGALMH